MSTDQQHNSATAIEKGAVSANLNVENQSELLINKQVVKQPTVKTAPVVTTPKAATKKPPKAKKTERVVRITAPVSGRFLLSYHVGQTVALERKQAEELVEAGYAKFV